MILAGQGVFGPAPTRQIACVATRTPAVTAVIRGNPARQLGKNPAAKASPRYPKILRARQPVAYDRRFKRHNGVVIGEGCGNFRGYN